MAKAIVTYETQHGSAKKVAEVVGKELGCDVVNVDTPFQAEDLAEIQTIVLVFNFRGPYTAQLTKLYLGRVKDQLKNKNVVLVGEGLFSEKEFPVVANEIAKITPSKSFNKFFVSGQLRMATLYPEERALLKKFGELTGMEIKDMGELDLQKADEVAKEVAKVVKDNSAEDEPEERLEKVVDENGQTKWVCSLCGYEYTGEQPPEKCPLCGAPASAFKKKEA